MKPENMMRRIVEKAGSVFDSKGFLCHEDGFEEALRWYYRRREMDAIKSGDLTEAVTNFSTFAYEIGCMLELPTFEVKRYLRGQYSQVFYIFETFGQNYIEPK